MDQVRTGPCVYPKGTTRKTPSQKGRNTHQTTWWKWQEKVKLTWMKVWVNDLVLQLSGQSTRLICGGSRVQISLGPLKRKLKIVLDSQTKRSYSQNIRNNKAEISNHQPEYGEVVGSRQGVVEDVKNRTAGMAPDTCSAGIQERQKVSGCNHVSSNRSPLQGKPFKSFLIKFGAGQLSTKTDQNFSGMSHGAGAILVRPGTSQT